MKILKANAGSFTNFEVLDFLRSRNATSDPMGCLGSVAASECKVYNYLAQSAACNQTREHIDAFLKGSANVGLADAEKLNIINLRPDTLPKLYPVVEKAGSERISDEMLGDVVDLVNRVLPPPPAPIS